MIFESQNVNNGIDIGACKVVNRGVVGICESTLVPRLAGLCQEQRGHPFHKRGTSAAKRGVGYR
jgi:hypothetical protein